MRTRVVLLAILIFSSVTVSADVIYYCTKDGKKLVTDKPCQELGAQEKKRVNAEDLRPLNTTRGLTQGDLNRSQEIDDRLDRRNQADAENREERRAQAQVEQAQGKAACSGLEQEKKNIVVAQRSPLSSQAQDYYRERLRWVNDELYRLNCETL